MIKKRKAPLRKSDLADARSDLARSQHYETESAWQDLSLDWLRIIAIDFEFV